MKIIRFLNSLGEVVYGCDYDGSSALKLAGYQFSWTRTSERQEVTKLLAPVVPSSILGIGLNYKRHAEEGAGSGPFEIPEYPVLFFKGINSVQNPGDPIVLPRFLRSEQVDYECELAVVIGKVCKNVDVADAINFVAGFTCANDVSARDWQIQHGGSQWSRGKSFDTFAPLGPCLVTPDEFDPGAARIQTVLNEEVVQDWNTNDMIFNVCEIISFLSGSTTLLPGTVILTGTPHGVGMAQNPPRYLRQGDVVSILIDGIGELVNPVIEEKP